LPKGEKKKRASVPSRADQGKGIPNLRKRAPKDTLKDTAITEKREDTPTL